MKNPSKLTATDLCVMCGMCIPHCPTYQLYQNETESPRGRIALMQAISSGQIPADKTALQHIDHCLGCLNCESICPSKVPYGQIIDDFRHQHCTAIAKPILSRQILKHAGNTGGLEKLIQLAQLPGIKQVASFLNLIPDAFLNKKPLEFNNTYPASPQPVKPEQAKGKVLLFTGCTGKLTDSDTLHSAIKILNKLGFEVQLPAQQMCCGALHQHNGLKDQGQALLDEAEQQLKLYPSATVLFFSPACGASLNQLKQANIMDARLFILNALQHQPLAFSPHDNPVALHESCSHRNMLKLKPLNNDLLNCIENLDIKHSSQASQCCGAGGLQSFNYPKQAQALLDSTLQSFELSQCDALISDNIGCSLHIKSAISAYNPTIEVLHPLTFLARHLKP